jgi:putative hemolysin
VSSTTSRALKLLLASCIATAVVGCASAGVAQPTQTPESGGQMPNPASQYCVEQGGALKIEERGDLGQYGVCTFGDDMECEEWAMFRGECPVGGVNVKGYVTPAARYCAITGGEYEVTGNANTDQEQGSCTFKNGQTCDVWEYYDGTCNPTAAGEESSYEDPFAYCAAVGTIDTPGPDYTGPQVPESVAKGLQTAMNAPDTPLSVLESGSYWRCMDGSVYACFVGANLPCEAKANTDRAPTQEEIDYCLQNPASDFIPAAVTGRETVYEWSCVDGAPQIVKQVFQPDAQGFLSEIWYKINPQ